MYAMKMLYKDDVVKRNQVERMDAYLTKFRTHMLSMSSVEGYALPDGLPIELLLASNCATPTK